MTRTVTVKGADTLARTLNGFATDVADNAAAVRDGARLVTTRAASRAPRRTGALAASVSSDITGDTASISSGSAYAGAHNYGTGPRPGLRGPHNIRRTQWLTGALADSEANIVRIIETDTVRKLGRVRGA